MDASIPDIKRAAIASLVETRLATLPDGEELLATVVRLPAGRLTVFVLDVADPELILGLEEAVRTLA